MAALGQLHPSCSLCMARTLFTRDTSALERRRKAHRGAMRMSRFCFSGLVFLLAASVSASSSSRSPLADAAEKSDRAAIRALLKQAEAAPTPHSALRTPHFLNASQRDGMTALHWAARLDDLETVAVLLKAGADPQSTNRYGVTPLSLACENGNTELVELLLAAGAGPNTTLHGGETVLMTAARTGKPAPVKALLA